MDSEISFKKKSKRSKRLRNMRKVISITLLCLLIASNNHDAFAAVEKIDMLNWHYNVVGNEARISAVTTPEVYQDTKKPYLLGYVVIPSELGGMPVTYVNWNHRHNQIFSLTIPPSLNCIENAYYADLDEIFAADVTYTDLDEIYAADVASWCYLNFRPLGAKYDLYLNKQLIEDLTIPNSVTNLLGYTFYGCRSLRDVTIGDGVTNIGTAAFSGCDNLRDVSVGSSVINIESNAFSNCYRIRNVLVGNSVTNLGDDAFANSADFTRHLNVTLGRGVNSIGKRAFYHAGLEKLTMGENVAVIGERAFDSVPLKDLVLSSKLSRIEDNAFSQCDRLSNVVFSVGSVKIGNSAFWGCGALETLIIPAGGATIGNETFRGCSSLNNVIIGDGETRIGKDAFFQCYGVTNVVLGSGTAEIGDRAFFRCHIENLELPESLVKIGDSAFYECYGFSNLSLKGVVDIGCSAFYGCSSLRRLSIEGTTRIGTNAFYECSSLQDLTIGRAVINTTRQGVIERHAFQNCQNLRSVRIEGGIETIGAGSFSGCSSLTNLVLGNKLAVIGSSAFYGCCRLKEVVVPVSVTNINGSAFAACSNLVSILVPTTCVIRGGAIPGWTNLRRYKPQQNALFDANGGFVGLAGMNVEFGSVYGELPKPERIGYTFVGWDLDGETIASNSVVRTVDDHTLVARWQINTYTITFDANGGVGGKSEMLSYGETLIPAEVAKRGYTFKGWNVEPPTTVPAEDVTFTALWDANNYRIVFDANGGGGHMDDLVVSYDAVIALSDNKFVFEGLYFVGWATNDFGAVVYEDFTSVSNLSHVANDVVSLYAVWSEMPDAFPVVKTDADVPSALSGATDFLLAENIRDKQSYDAYRAWVNKKGFSHYEVKESSRAWLSYLLDTSSIIAKKIKKKDFSIRQFVCRDNGCYLLEVGVDGVDIGDDATASNLAKVFGIEGSMSPISGDFSSENLIFTICPSTDGVARIITEPKDGNAESFFLRATMRDFYGDVPVVSFNLNGGGNFSGTLEETKLVDCDDEYGTLPTPIRAGHTFDGWYTASNGGIKVTGATTIITNGAHTLYAHWLPNTYTIIFDPNGGICSLASKAVTYGNLFEVLPTPYMDGYGFDGWFTEPIGGVQIMSSDIVDISENIKVYAHWWAKAEFIVTFNANGGTVSPITKTVAYRSSYGALPMPVRTNFTFDGWYTALSGGIRITGDSTVATSSAHTLYAHWTKNAYDVTFDANGGNGGTIINVAYGNAVGELPEPSRDGYNFLGWYTEAVGGVQITSDTLIYQDVTYYAHWSQAVSAQSKYCIVDLSGGANAASYPVSYLNSVPSGGWSDTYKTTKLVLRKIEPGTFTMGGTCQVTLTKPYYIGVFELTQKQYKLIMGALPHTTGQSFADALPVEGPSWNTVRGAEWPSSAQAAESSFMGVLSAKTGLVFDLPTEAQWEYACRAGTTSTYNNGGNSESDLRTLGRYTSNRSDGKGGSYSYYTKVGSYAANAWGLYDMHGNVKEWCLDYYSSSSLPASATDPVGPLTGSSRMLRGGGWESSASLCSSANRWSCAAPGDGYYDMGFRVKCVTE